ncbi:unnamed protein product, partial [Rotaria magnacalcarata]
YVVCGINEQGSIVTNCPVCMVYQNQYDSNRIVRRCCWYNCGVDNSIKVYEGRRAYFCESHLCNRQGSENVLVGSSVLSTPSTTMTTRVTNATALTTTHQVVTETLMATSKDYTTFTMKTTEPYVIEEMTTTELPTTETLTSHLEEIITSELPAIQTTFSEVLTTSEMETTHENGRLFSLPATI